MDRLEPSIQILRNGRSKQNVCMDIFMQVNGIRAEAKKRTVFLASIGPSPYKLLIEEFASTRQASRN